MAASTNKAMVAELINFLAGRGFPTVAGSDRKVELEVMKRVQALEPEKQSARETHDAIAGNWRLVFTTNEQLVTLSSIMGGPLKLYFESVGNDAIHSATPFKAPFILLMTPVVIFACILVAAVNKIGFIASIFVTALAFRLVAKFGPSGLYASRRTGLTVSEDMVVTSRLDRDVLAIVASQFGFHKDHSDPMATFCGQFDNANGSKDPLTVGVFLGWRLVPKPLALHLKTHDTIRREKVIYVDSQIRIMLGGDVRKDGSATQALSIYVRSSPSS